MLTFNRTIVGLKRISYSFGNRIFYPFNRTIVGLKHPLPD